MRKICLQLAVGLSAAVMVAGWAACGGNNSAQITPTVTNVTLSDPATCAGPSGPYSHVYVTVTDVQASTSASGSGGFTDLTPNLKSAPQQIDLLGQANNQCFLASLGSTTQLQAGDYQQIRLILADNSTAVTGNKCGGNGANCVVLNDGTAAKLNLASEAQTGIKIPAGQIAGGKFTVQAGTTQDLNIDFNTCDSIVVEGNGQYRLKPVLHAGEVSTTATSITGTVVDKATSQPVSGTTMVALEQKDAGGTDRIFMATLADASGHFVFCPVPAGSYDVVATAISSTNVIYAATLTTGVSVGASLGNIPLIAAQAPAGVAGQVTTSTGSAGTAADISLSALQTATVGTSTVTFTVPLTAQSSGTASLATAAGASCAANTDCVAYTLQLPGAPANAGSFSASGTTWTQATAATVDTTVEADAFVPSSGGTPDCTPAVETTTQTSAAAALSLGPGLSLTAATLAFTGCQ
jgi:hypothetical protein